MLYKQPPGLQRLVSTAFVSSSLIRGCCCFHAWPQWPLTQHEVLQNRGRKEVMEKVCSMQFGASEAAKLLSSTALARLRNLDLPYCGM